MKNNIATHYAGQEPAGPFGEVSDDELCTVLSAKNLRQKERIEEDYLFVNGNGGGVLSTIDQGQMYGETGTGKTLKAVAMAAAVASGRNHLHWRCLKPRKVVYFDGELAETTMVERLELATQEFTEDERRLVDENLTIFNRDTAFNELGVELAPLDSVAGQRQVEYLVDLLGAEMAVFDSRFCLLSADMKEAGSMPKNLILSLRRRKVCSLWLHHTGKDTSRGGYGDKTAEFLIDFNIELASTSMQGELSMTWRKKRKCNDVNADLYADISIQCKDGLWWRKGTTPNTGRKGNRTVTNEDLVMRAMTDLTIAAQNLEVAQGGKADTMPAIHRGKIRERLIDKGHFEAEDGVMTTTDRKALNKAISNHIENNKLTGDKDYISLVKR